MQVHGQRKVTRQVQPFMSERGSTTCDYMANTKIPGECSPSCLSMNCITIFGNRLPDQPRSGYNVQRRGVEVAHSRREQTASGWACGSASAQLPPEGSPGRSQNKSEQPAPTRLSSCCRRPSARSALAALCAPRQL